MLAVSHTSFNFFNAVANILIGRVRKIATTDYYLRHVCPSVSPYGTTPLLLDGFSWNLIHEYFSKIFREN